MIIMPATVRQMKMIKPLYLSAFPRNERKPFWLIKKKVSEGKMKIMAIEEEGFAGLAILMLYKDIVLLDYFAISPSRRDEGLGSEALKILRDMFSERRLFLEIELPDGGENDYIKERRKAFYLRNGLVETGFKASVFGVPMEMLTFGSIISMDDYFGIYRYVLGSFLASKVRPLE